MLSYCLKCKKTESINLKVLKPSNGRSMLLSRCAICGTKKLRFIKEQEAKELLSNLGLKTPLSKILLLGDILFQMLLNYYKMNDMVSRFLLLGDKFVPEMHLRQPRFTYSIYGPFTKNKETGDTRYSQK